MINVAQDGQSVAQIVDWVADGSTRAEKLAVQLAVSHFDRGEGSAAFLTAAARACAYQRMPELARRILDVRPTPALPDAVLIDLLATAGRHDEAENLLLEVLPTAEIEEAAEFGSIWRRLVKRNPRLKSELAAGNAAMVDYLDSLESR